VYMTYEIACLDCKVSLWVGQGNRIYYTEEDLKKQRDFFFGHVGHHLEFNSTDYFAAADGFRDLEDEEA